MVYPQNFIKHFGLIYNVFYIKSINYSCDNKCHYTHTKKKEKDTRLITNWRPILLLNIDYKIAAKVLASRLKQVLNNVISKDQTCFLTGRYIAINVRALIEIIEDASKNE